MNKKKFREIVFLSVLNIFPVQKIDFRPFLKLQKNGIWSKICFVKLIYLISGVCLAWTFLIFLPIVLHTLVNILGQKGAKKSVSLT